MKILITGGAGFIGSHLADLLLARGHTIHVLDDLTTGAIENIRHLKDHPGFGYTIDSASNSAVVAELVDEVDAVCHLAAAVGVKLIVESPVRTIETNVHCTEVVLAHANKKKKPVLFASTSEVYGKSRELPFREDGDLQMGAPDVGRWAYACSKAIDECLAMAYWKERRLPTIVARLFNTVGPRQTGRYGMVVPRLVRQALAAQPLTVYGDGQQTRCFCHVGDVVRALADLLVEERAYGEVINVGSSEEISIRDLAHAIIEQTGSPSEVVLVPYAEAYETGFEDMARRVPDTGKIAGLIGWHATLGLRQIVDDVAAYQGEAPARAISVGSAPAGL
ncbi:MAG TPA: GDP-mannose 4,6-dehydratase [Solirubrobacteraceae bacterium]